MVMVHAATRRSTGVDALSGYPDSVAGTYTGRRGRDFHLTVRKSSLRL